MSGRENSIWAGLVAGAPGSEPWTTGLFMLFLLSLGGAATFILFQDGKEFVLLVALAVGASLWGLERLETRYTACASRSRDVVGGFLPPAVVISLAVTVVCYPTLNMYFFGEDFAYLHHFDIMSWGRFLGLFHTDIAQILWGDPGQELRPFYGLYFMVSYQMWGLHPMGYHLTSVLLHIVNCSLVFLIVKHLGPGGTWRAGFAALLFAVLPLHSDIFYWATGAPAELIPVFFYLAGFLCFMRFRATGLTRYLVVTVVAFAGCLASKETAVTLPVMLISYDLFRKATAEKVIPVGGDPVRKRRRWMYILGCLPFAVLLLAYLELRHSVTGDYLRVSQWGNIRAALSSPAGFWLHLHHFAARLWNLQAFNLRHLLLPHPAPALGIALGLYLVWVYSLLRRYSECRRSLIPVLYFGLVWYLISNVPLLIVILFVYHLYLPAVGPCIAASFLAFPVCQDLRRVPRYLRLVSCGFLIVLSASQLWKENAEWARRGELSAKMTAELGAALEDLPKGTLAVIWPGMTFSALVETLPYPLMPPVATTDLLARSNIIADRDLYNGTPSKWCDNTRRVLDSELAGAPGAALETQLLTWDPRSNSLQRKKRVLSRGLLGACVTTSLGGSVGTVGALGDTESKVLVEALGRLVSEGRCVAVQR